MITRLVPNTRLVAAADDLPFGPPAFAVRRLAAVMTGIGLSILVCTASATAKSKAPAASQETASPPASSEPARAMSAWRGGQIPGGDARTAYCAVEAEFANGITLSVARSGAGAVTMALLVPGLYAAGPATWPVTLTLASTANPPLTTALTASVVDATNAATIIAFPLDTIPDPQSRLAASDTLTLDSAADRTSFRIPNGTADAMTQLTTCASAIR